jgi:hypothetical protein
MDPASASYDESGRVVCRACLSAASAAASSRTIAELDPSTTRNLYGAASASALLGVTSCCVSGLGDWFFVAAAMPIVSGIGTLLLLVRDSTIRPRLGGGYWLVIGLALCGIAFGGLASLIGVLGLAMRLGG